MIWNSSTVLPWPDSAITMRRTWPAFSGTVTHVFPRSCDCRTRVRSRMRS